MAPACHSHFRVCLAAQLVPQAYGVTWHNSKEGQLILDVEILMVFQERYDLGLLRGWKE